MAQDKPAAEPTIVFNKKEYPIKSLSKDVQKQVQSLRFAEMETQRLRALLAVAQTAANAYRNAIAANLPKDDSPAA